MSQTWNHQCKRGMTVRLQVGSKCPLCGGIQGAGPPQVDPLLVKLKDLDESDVEVTSWEADYIESILHRWRGPLTDTQREKIEEILERYS